MQFLPSLAARRESDRAMSAALVALVALVCIARSVCALPDPSPMRIRLYAFTRYCGRDILAPNSDTGADKADDRGYVPVEWWIMSMTTCLNEAPKENEGHTQLILGGAPGAYETARFADAVVAAGEVLLGDYVERWLVSPQFIPCAAPWSMADKCNSFDP